MHPLNPGLVTLNHLTQKFSSAYEEPADFTVHCPKCDSTEIMLLGPESDSSEAPDQNEESEGRDERHDHDVDVKPAASDASFTWKCDACGYELQYEPTESES